MQSHEAELEQLYGPSAPHSEHKRGDRITYHLADEEGKYSGVILWVCEQNDRVGMCYVVERDGAGDSFPDIAFPADIIADRS